MKTILHRLCSILGLCLAIFHPLSSIGQTLPSTPYTRSWLRATNETHARTLLGFAPTNAAVINPWNININAAGYSLTNAGSLTTTGAVTAGSFVGSASAVTGDDEAYDATGWNSDTTFPTKNAVRDQMELKASLSEATNIAAQAVATAMVNSWEFAATNTLWVSASLGNDTTAAANDPTLPWATIAGAMANADGGDVVRVTAGTYNETVQMGSNTTLVADFGANILTLGTTNRSGLPTNYPWRIVGNGTVSNMWVWSEQPLYVDLYSVPSLLILGGLGRHVVRSQGDIGTVRLLSSGESASLTNYTVTTETGLTGTYSVESYYADSAPTIRVNLGHQAGLTLENLGGYGAINVDFRVRRLNGDVKPLTSVTTVSNRVSLGGREGRWIWKGQAYVPSSKSKTGRLPHFTVDSCDWLVPSGSNAIYAATEGTSSQIPLYFYNTRINTTSLTNAAGWSISNSPAVLTDLENYAQ